MMIFVNILLAASIILLLATIGVLVKWYFEDKKTRKEFVINETKKEFDLVASKVLNDLISAMKDMEAANKLLLEAQKDLDQYNQEQKVASPSAGNSVVARIHQARGNGDKKSN